MLLENAPRSYNRYFEPFLGAASLFLALAPGRSLISDINSELINFYETLSSMREEAVDKLKNLKADRETYYRLRSENKDNMSQIDRAVRFYYLNRFCYNGIYRENREGKFNVPFGDKSGEVPSESNLLNVADLLRGAKISCSDYKAALQEAGGGDFVYLDPPYKSGDRRSTGEFTYMSFQHNNWSELAELAHALHDKGCYIMISYKKCDDVESELDGWNVIEVPVRRSLSSSVKSRGWETEYLVKNYV